MMDFTVTETDEEIVIRGGPAGEIVARFPGGPGSGCSNPAFAAFVQGLLSFEGSELWNESTARYMVSYGSLDESSARDIAEIQAAATEATEQLSQAAERSRGQRSPS